VEQLEALLLLRSEPDRWWDPEEVAEQLATQPASVTRRLRDLVGHGLVAERPGDRDGVRRFGYSPAASELDDGVTALAHAYATRRSSVIATIFADPEPNRIIRSFADAFRLGRPKGERNDG